MATKTDTSEQRGVAERKTEVISRKVWDLETVMPKVSGINGDGSIPVQLTKTMKNGEMRRTDYKDSVTDATKIIYKTNNRVYSFWMEEET